MHWCREKYSIKHNCMWPLGNGLCQHFIYYYRPKAPNFLGTRGRFCGEKFFHGTEGYMVFHAACIPYIGLCLFARSGFWHAVEQGQSMDWGLGTPVIGKKREREREKRR
uniref:Uncharacterized protein n=1 Tax=Micrurus corallinus TaxID=54390 RepID=A0A2D4ENC3_MICCO